MWNILMAVSNYDTSTKCILVDDPNLELFISKYDLIYINSFFLAALNLAMSSVTTKDMAFYMTISNCGPAPFRTQLVRPMASHEALICHHWFPTHLKMPLRPPWLGLANARKTKCLGISIVGGSVLAHRI
jgi:hypothetical protein